MRMGTAGVAARRENWRGHDSWGRARGGSYDSVFMTESARSPGTDCLRAPEETTAAPRSRSQPSIPLALPARIGNHAFAEFARTLARDVDTSAPFHSVPVLLVGPSPRVHASQRATPGNARLAAEIDEVDKLSDQELRKQHEVEALAISDPASRDADHERRLEAIEYVERWRRIGGPARVEAANPNWTHAEQGRNLRARLERGIAHFGTFTEAWLNLRYPAADFAGTANHVPHQDEDLDQIRKETQRFAGEFKRQAAHTAERMLKQSHDAILTLLKRYGVDAGTADDAGYMMARHYRDIDEQLPRVLEATKSSATVDSTAAKHMRWNLAQNAKWIREQQAVVAAADDKAGKDALKVPLNRDSGPEWDTVRADQQATAPSRYLQSHLHRRLSARARTPNCADSEPVAHEPFHPRNPEDCAIGMATDRASMGSYDGDRVPGTRSSGFGPSRQSRCVDKGAANSLG